MRTGALRRERGAAKEALCQCLSTYGIQLGRSLMLARAVVVGIVTLDHS